MVYLMNTYIKSLILPLVLLAAPHAKSENVPLLDSQPPYTEECPISNTASTGSGLDISHRNYGCEIDGVNVVWTLSIPDGCENGGCGLIIDIHGATMNAEQQNKGTRLREYGSIAQSYGASTPYIVMQPSMTDLFDGGSLDILSVIGNSYSNELPNIDYMIRDVMTAFSVDQGRIHMNGFSRGAATLSEYYCDINNRGIPISSYSTNGGIVFCSIKPNQPLIMTNGNTDPSFAAMIAFEKAFKKKPGYKKRTVKRDFRWSVPRVRWTWSEGIIAIGKQNHSKITADNGYVLETIKHSASSYPAFGHCLPILNDESWLACRANFDQGRKVIDFIVDYTE